MAAKHISAMGACVAAMALGGVVPAHATLQAFASFIPAAQATDVTFTNNGAGVNFNMGTGGTLSATTNGEIVKFTFLDGLQSYVSNLNAAFSFTATTVNTPVTTLGRIDVQKGLNGSFSFTTVAPLVIGGQTYSTGTNLLSGTFSAAGLSGRGGGTTANFSDTGATRATVSFTSSFLDFTNVGAEDITMPFNVVTPPLGFSPGDALQSFIASSTGKFSSDPQPRIVAMIPEPSTWALMLLGFGGLGLAVRRRSALAA